MVWVRRNWKNYFHLQLAVAQLVLCVRATCCNFRFLVPQDACLPFYVLLCLFGTVFLLELCLVNHYPSFVIVFMISLLVTCIGLVCKLFLASS